MTKKDLRTGMFGYCNDEPDDIFVVVNNTLVYRNGFFDPFYNLNDDLTMAFTDAKIIALFEAECFQEVLEGEAHLIWKREEEN